ncbi:MAG: hypothetical protein HRU38_13875 [Saccharospirillaceae bacterium]|nr:hypothetical protein [Pseudomonadales bacterium]NRB79734.1 hypothetical protein [Saccharospirillaceae bacterium]
MAKQIDSFENPLVFLKQLLNLAKVNDKLKWLNVMQCDVLNDINDSSYLDESLIKQAIDIVNTDIFIQQIKELNTAFISVKATDENEKAVFNIIDCQTNYHYLFETTIKADLLSMQQLKNNVPDTVWHSIRDSWHG